MRATREALAVPFHVNLTCHWCGRSEEDHAADCRLWAALAEVAVFERIAEAAYAAAFMAVSDDPEEQRLYEELVAALADLDRLRGQTEGDHHAGHSAHPGETVPVAPSACPCDGLVDLFRAQGDTTDKVTAHAYPTLYERIFAQRRDEVRALLEIGIGQGGSIRCWQHYFPNAVIYALDIEQRLVDGVAGLERVQATRLDVGKRIHLEGWARRIRALDIVIDDGSHKVMEIITAWQVLWPLVREGGYYIIEDAAQVDSAPVLSEWLALLSTKALQGEFSLEVHENLLLVRRP